MKIHEDPIGDIYRVMDAAKLDITKFSTTAPMSKIINEIRTQLAQGMKEYIAARDKVVFDAGVQKGMADAQTPTEI